MRKKILIVFGTRPEAIKMAPLVIEFNRNPELFETIVCVTAQHREMLDQVLNIFDIKPNYDLNIMKSGQDLFDITSNVILGLRSVLLEVNPNYVLVHGDTTTSTVAALAAYYQKIRVCHIEAGLRTHNIYSPWPEEMNRQITGRLATYHFSPTQLSKQNLIAENVNKENIFVTGNTVIDALLLVLDKIKTDPNILEQIVFYLTKEGISRDMCNSWLINKRKLILITGHRRENFGQGFNNICNAILELSLIFPDVDFVYPMHYNPNVRSAIEMVFGSLNKTFKKLSNSSYHNIFFIEPLDYLPFVYLMNLSNMVLTDSGGIQEEAPSLGKPVLVMRDTTERPEALDAGTVKLVGTNKSTIIQEVSNVLLKKELYDHMASAKNPYGDGKACTRILDTFRSFK